MTAFKTGDPTALNRLYGRQSGHKLRAGQQELVDELLPRISVPADGPITAERLFGRDMPLHFEIGFGSGEHLAERAALLPEAAFVGCEPFLNGVVGALGTGLQVLTRVPDGALDCLYLLHPDPWPKARHAKRRMMNKGPVDMIAAKLRPGGEFRFGTDHPIYLRWALMTMRERTDFEWLCETPTDFLTRPDDWSETRYEAKARRKGHEVWYFRYRRK